MADERLLTPGPGMAAAALLLGALIGTTAPSKALAAPAPADCRPVNGYGFVCGLIRAEDLKLIPGTRWLVASGIADGAGLKLIDTDAKTARPWWTGAPDELRPDKARYPQCPGAPDPAHFATHGLSLRADARGGQTLYVVNHGGRETIEVFAVEPSADAPKAVWVGCAPMPAGLAGNGVAALDDGTILTTVQLHPGRTVADQVLGKPTGGVYQWRPGEPGFRMLPATELPGDNGIETSPDGRQFYVIGAGANAVFVYDRADTAKGAVRKAEAPGFMPDNLSWTTPPGGGPAIMPPGRMRSSTPCIRQCSTSGCSWLASDAGTATITSLPIQSTAMDPNFAAPPCCWPSAPWP